MPPLDLRQARAGRGGFTRADDTTAALPKPNPPLPKSRSVSEGLDAFVANATAACRFQNILNTTEEEYDFIMDSNTKAYFFGTQAAAQLMIESCVPRRHRADRLGAFPAALSPTESPYAISKGGIEVLGRNAAYELGKYGIRGQLPDSGRHC